MTDQPTLSLTVKDLAVRFNRRSVLNGISFSAASGDLITVVGENAAGKTTLLKSLAGLVKYDGSVTLAEHGTALSDASVVYLPQLTAVTSHLSVFETVMLGLGQRLSWRIDDEVFDRTDAQLHAMNISRGTARTETLRRPKAARLYGSGLYFSAPAAAFGRTDECP